MPSSPFQPYDLEPTATAKPAFTDAGSETVSETVSDRKFLSFHSRLTLLLVTYSMWFPLADDPVVDFNHAPELAVNLETITYVR
jgi:hypothetical protein